MAQLGDVPKDVSLLAAADMALDFLTLSRHGITSFMFKRNLLVNSTTSTSCTFNPSLPLGHDIQMMRTELT